MTIALLCLLPTIVAVFLAITESRRGPGEGPAFLSAVLANGALYPAAALGIVLPLFLPVAVAVVAGDSIAGEASAGTLRYLLARPVGRTRLLVAKLAAVIVVHAAARWSPSPARRTSSGSACSARARCAADRRHGCPGSRCTTEQLPSAPCCMVALHRAGRCSASRRSRCSCRR